MALDAQAAALTYRKRWRIRKERWYRRPLRNDRIIHHLFPDAGPADSWEIVPAVLELDA